MKRNYVTPVIAVEYYDLTQSIAACVTKINFKTADCVIKDSDSTQQMIDMAHFAKWFIECDEMAVDMGNDAYCYHTNANAAFTS